MAARFQGKSVLVTGAASGIGLAAARLFADEGARLTLVDLNGVAAGTAAAELRGAGHAAQAVTADIADPAACEAAVAAALDAYGRLDIAFNNAGMPSAIAAEFEDMTPDQWRRLIDVNLSGLFHCLRAEVPALKAAGGGAIVNTASVAAHVAAPGMAAYVASKHGAAGLTKAAALDLIRHNIRVNAVCPGITATPMLGAAGEDPAIVAAITAGVPLGRMAEADEIARAVLFLASDEASYLVGALLTADGGVTIQ